MKFALFSALFGSFLITADPAWAQQSLGDVIQNTVESFQTTPGLLAGFSYLCGLILGIWGVLRLRMHVETPNQVEIWDPMKRFFAGGAFFVLPEVVRAAHDTISKGGSELSGNDYNTSGVSGGGLDAKLVALMKDVWEPLQWLFVGFSYLAGIILIMIGISRLLKSEQEGARGPMGIGTIMTFLVAGVLLSLNKTLGAAVNSVFDSGAKNKAVLSYKAGMDGAAVTHAEAVIGAIMAFVAIIGWISFIRGFFIMRGVAEGNSQASMMAGVTHIIGGAVAVNLGAFIEAVQQTLGIKKYGLDIQGASLDLEPYLTTVTFIV